MWWCITSTDGREGVDFSVIGGGKAVWEWTQNCLFNSLSGCKSKEGFVWAGENVNLFRKKAWVMKDVSQITDAASHSVVVFQVGRALSCKSTRLRSPNHNACHRSGSWRRKQFSRVAQRKSVETLTAQKWKKNPFLEPSSGNQIFVMSQENGLVFSFWCTLYKDMFYLR